MATDSLSLSICSYITWRSEPKENDNIYIYMLGNAYNTRLLFTMHCRGVEGNRNHIGADGGPSVMILLWSEKLMRWGGL